MTDWVTWSNVLGRLAYPSTVILLLVLLAFISLLLRRRKVAGSALFVALGLVFLCSSPIISELYSNHERTYLPIPIDKYPTVEAIVILAGDVGIPAAPRIESQVHGNRSIHALRLYRAGKAPLIIISGGNVFSQDSLRPEAAYTADLLEEWGIPPSAIIFEGNSRNTRENAVETAKLLNNRGLMRVLLVTTAFHMPRAIGAFRAVGIDAIPAPSSISAKLHEPTVLHWIPSLDGLGTMQRLMHEKIGIFVYRMRGWVSS